MKRMIKPYSRTYYRMEYEVLKNYVRTYPCKACGAPVHESYCCGRCGCVDPGSDDAEQDLEWQKQQR